MLKNLAKRMFGTVNDRALAAVDPIVEKVNSFEYNIADLSDKELKAKTDYFRDLLKEGKTLDDILPEAFAVVREASKRVLGMRHYDVQIVGGVVLHRGKIAEMKTGEGKTLVATLPTYLNAVEGKGVHVVTVNDYLAKRDSEWMGKIHEFLGLSVGCIENNMDDDERATAYACDVTYGTNNEFGFDYLRDNMKFSREEMVMGKYNFAIVDEVDSILIDEARTPLIISGPTEDNSELYYRVNELIPLLKESDYEIDEKAKTVVLTDDGNAHAERILKDHGLLESSSSLYDITSISLVHHVNQALKAHKIFEKDVDYMLKGNDVLIIDEFTGRAMEGRRYSDGLHQALEAKENVPVHNENQTLASITFQNYFRLYPKLAGMTGTAMTEATEFMDTYKLDVISIPPNLPVTRSDDEDEIYRTTTEKFNAIVEEIISCHKKGQPILVGTVSIERSELISNILKKRKIPHNVLNAKHHEKEAHIIAQAGHPGAITIATNMAGRGTDIMLGGNPEMLLEDAVDANTTKAKVQALQKKIEEKIAQDKQKVLKAGGLYVLGTERHESRRIDNQLRGRAGRQGDPGLSKFFISLEDDLMRIFGSERISGVLHKLGVEEGDAITSPLISRAIEKAQGKVEQHNFEIRKNLLKFDNVMNDQRKVIYEQRIELMETEDVSDTVRDMRDEISESLVLEYVPPKSYPEQWDTRSLEKELYRVYGVKLPVSNWAKKEGIADEEILDNVDKSIDKLFEAKDKKYGPEIMRMLEKRILLMTLDQLWKDHLLSLDHLRQGIGLRAYGQKDPLNEYKREAFGMFETMLSMLREVVTARLAHLELGLDEDEEELSRKLKKKQKQKTHESRMDPALEKQPAPTKLGTVVKKVNPDDRDPANPQSWGKVTRNESCPCGSGKKYKQCHGALV